MDFSLFLTVQDPKGWGSPNFFIYSRSESSCELHPLANVLHLPLSTCCLIHPFPNALFFPCPKVLVMDTWWITGYWKGRVTPVRSDQIGRLNSRFLVRRRWWGGCGGERKRKRVSISRCWVRTRCAAICQRVSSIPCTWGSSDSLFTWLKSEVSRRETLQNSSMLIPHSHRSAKSEWVLMDKEQCMLARTGFIDNVINSWPINMDR